MSRVAMNEHARLVPRHEPSQRTKCAPRFGSARNVTGLPSIVACSQCRAQPSTVPRPTMRTGTTPGLAKWALTLTSPTIVTAHEALVPEQPPSQPANT